MNPVRELKKIAAEIEQSMKQADIWAGVDQEEVIVRGENQSFEVELGTKKDAENLVDEAVDKLRKYLENTPEEEWLNELHQNFIREFVFDEDYGDEEDYRGAYYLVGLPEQEQLEMIRRALK